MTDFYIFRHGTTFQSKNGVEYGMNEETADILQESYPSLQKMGKFLKDIKTDINLTSPYKRCLATVKIISEFSKKEFSIDNRLGEYRQDMGGKLKFIERIKDFIDNINELKYQKVLFCTHGYPISAILQYLSQNKIEIPKLDNYPNPGILSIVENGEIRQIDFN